jgi:hypothetical protein
MHCQPSGHCTHQIILHGFNKTILGPMLPPGGRNWQLTFPHCVNLNIVYCITMTTDTYSDLFIETHVFVVNCVAL